jgi:hypothetical protein
MAPAAILRPSPLRLRLFATTGSQLDRILNAVRTPHRAPPHFLANLSARAQHDSLLLRHAIPSHLRDQAIDLVPALVASRIGAGKDALREIATPETGLA